MSTQFGIVKKTAGLVAMAAVVTAMGLGLGSGMAQAKPPPKPPSCCTTFTNVFDGFTDIFTGEHNSTDTRVDKSFFGSPKK